MTSLKTFDLIALELREYDFFCDLGQFYSVQRAPFLSKIFFPYMYSNFCFKHLEVAAGSEPSKNGMTSFPMRIIFHLVADNVLERGIFKILSKNDISKYFRILCVQCVVSMLAFA